MEHPPTKQQDEIYQTAELGGNLMISARAGCGKSTTLVGIAEVLAPKRIIMLAFNKSAQLDLEKKIADAGLSNASALTFNSLGHRSMTGRLTLNKRKPYLLLDDLQRDKNITFTRSEQSDLVALLNASRNAGMIPPAFGGIPLRPYDDESWEHIFEKCEVEWKDDTLRFAKMLLEMSISRMNSGLIDFLDQLYRPALWGGNFPPADAYLIDEAQDLNPLQHKLTRLLPTRQIIAVGDERQAIYAFRGAFSDSMERLQFELGNPPILPLSQTWRCAHAIVARQLHLVPDFKPADNAPQGDILDWTSEPWDSIHVSDGTAILCRNNAPLIATALKLLAKGRKVTILGREFAERLQRDIEKAIGEKAPSSTPIDHALSLLQQYYLKRKERRNPELTPTEADRIDSLRKVAELGDCKDVGALRKLLDRIFSEEKAPITLATAHKAKGLEWDTVIHLDPHLIPSKYAKSEEELAQEANIRYVLETRPRHTLILACSEDME